MTIGTVCRITPFLNQIVAPSKEKIPCGVVERASPPCFPSHASTHHMNHRPVAQRLNAGCDLTKECVTRQRDVRQRSARRIDNLIDRIGRENTPQIDGVPTPSYRRGALSRRALRLQRIKDLIRGATPRSSQHVTVCTARRVDCRKASGNQQIVDVLPRSGGLFVLSCIAAQCIPVFFVAASSERTAGSHTDSRVAVRDSAQPIHIHSNGFVEILNLLFPH